MAFDVRRGEAYTVQVESDQVDIAGFALLENGTPIAETPADPGGVQFRFETGRAPGTYVYVVRAFGHEVDDLGVPEFADSAPVTWGVGHAFPAKPVGKVVKVT